MKTERAIFKERVEEIDYKLSGKALNTAFAAYKKLNKRLSGANP